ncbi:hypothetical protein BGK72_04820 [Streptomyces agglomeratus]|nr:hypothetical protein BGK72_04820 [Streptomyces agglomeratus]
MCRSTSVHASWYVSQSVAGSPSLYAVFASSALKYAVREGWAPRSTDVSRPSCRTLTRAHTPMGSASSSSLGISRAMPRTFLSAPQSTPVHWKSLRMPSRSAKNGSLRRPAEKRYGPASTTWGSAPKETGASVMNSCPPGSGLRACAPVAQYTLAVCCPSAGGEKTKLNATSGRSSPSTSTLMR